MANKSEALVKFDQSYAVQVRETLELTVGEMGVDTFDLPRIGMPQGKAAAFDVPQPGEDSAAMKSFSAIVLCAKTGEKAWWATPYDQAGGGTPPDCVSHGNQRGFGINTLNEDGSAAQEDVIPGDHDCKTCPHNQFGSSRKEGSTGKDCRDVQVLYLLLPGSFLPSVLVVPPTSLKNVKQHALSLIAGGVQPHSVLTKFALEADKSGSGITYHKLSLSVDRKLTDEEAAQFEDVIAKAKELLLNQVIDITPSDLGEGVADEG